MSTRILTEEERRQKRREAVQNKGKTRRKSSHFKKSEYVTRSAENTNNT